MSGIANQEYDLSCVPYNDGPRWYVMRDLTRTNAKMPAYKMLEGMVSKVFTPMTWKVVKVKGKGERVQVPFMHDLLFVYDRRKNRVSPKSRLQSLLSFSVLCTQFG